jgi:hypothetical protein
VVFTSVLKAAFRTSSHRIIVHPPDQGTDPRQLCLSPKDWTTESEMSDNPTPESGPQGQQVNEVVVDDTSTVPSYSNFCRVTATPEEVILDFGLNPQPFATGRQEVKAIQRIVMNFYTSKRLLTALGMTIQRHEQTFGAIELDVRRRAGSAQQQFSPPTPRGPQGIVE